MIFTSTELFLNGLVEDEVTDFDISTDGNIKHGFAFADSLEAAGGNELPKNRNPR